ncbi:hypothetical protein ACVNS2_02455 [Paenibacillus caseinilyticus]|uniref:Uncharacterized protein n=1 Tax=Paenibacillus mucilaginosus K02 TaxID=997761 RepID=I0BB26_9BACL|nr:hypothetical protein [Paenibacillus mucilaginosus]AFH59573.1 hypothetical protein B2K_02340 [Paenibacillus mucilaginosus K02]
MTLTSVESPDWQYQQRDCMLLDAMEQRIVRLTQKNTTLLGVVTQNTEALELTKVAVTSNKNRLRQLWRQLIELRIHNH